jgi:hypothetical protein
VNALRGKMQKQQVETLLTARSVLTPDQVKKIKTVMETRGGGPGRGPMMERHGTMGRPPGHPGGSAPHPQAPPVQ